LIDHAMGLQTEKIVLWILLFLLVGLLLAWGNWQRARQMAAVAAQAHALHLVEEKQATPLDWEYLATGTVDGLLVSIGVRVQEHERVAVVTGALQNMLGRVMIRPLSRVGSELRSAHRILSSDPIFDASFLIVVLDATGRPLPGDPLTTELATATPAWMDETVRTRVVAIRRLQAIIITDESASVRIMSWNAADLNAAVEVVTALGRWPNRRADGSGYRR
jgi:hypothetical protein